MLIDWIKCLACSLLAIGLLAPDDCAAEEIAETPITAEDREHWSFRALKRPEVPQLAGDIAENSNPIDRFILARLSTAQLKPAAAADRPTLIRRVTFDLTGLPPTAEQVAAFIADDAPGAYQRVVDRLLASEAYGEHAARHWLDLARYAESDGFEFDQRRPEAWRYRDWVIQAMNSDLPYGEFVRLQLAADESHPGDAAAAIPTGFLLAGPDMPDINLQEERRHTVLNEMTSTVGAVFLGLQVGCAQCHDHKVDPISQADFYRLRAHFESADLFRTDLPYRVLQEKPGPWPASHLMTRGDFRRPGAELTAGYPRIANAWNDAPPQQANESAADGPSAGGRRMALAAWLTRPDHPLTWRVMANRLWQQHFGAGLSETPSDFGLMGDAPSHPELLDWLACELASSGSLKQLHRLMVSSRTYQQASRPTDPDDADWLAARAADPRNRLLARMNRQRLSGEAIRDAMLQAAGRLNHERGGPGVMPPLPAELLATIPAAHWQASEHEADHYRRSIYLFVRRNLRYPLFEAFDGPDTISSCARRNRSTTAPQALVLLNGEFSLAMARDQAGLILQQAATASDQVALAWQRTLSRQPSAAELQAAVAFLAAQTEQLQQAGQEPGSLALPRPQAVEADLFAQAALVDLCLALFNLNEFIYID